jgi:hypothetical protein
MINIVFYTNCQYMGIVPNLQLNMTNINVNVISNYTYINNKFDLPIDFLKNCNLFIYQPIEKKHGIYATDTLDGITSYLPDECLKISFPYIYNSGIWGITKDAIDNDDGTTCGNRDVIMQMNDKSLNEIIEMYHNNEIDFNYKSRFESSLLKLQEKEQKCNVCISEFIKNNIQNHKLFFTQNHPTPIAFAHVSYQILNIIKTKYTNNVKNEYIFANHNQLCDNVRWPICKSDIDYWKFNYIQTAEKEADNYYIELITKYYHNIKSKDEGIPDVYY